MTSQRSKGVAHEATKKMILQVNLNGKRTVFRGRDKRPGAGGPWPGHVRIRGRADPRTRGRADARTYISMEKTYVPVISNYA